MRFTSLPSSTILDFPLLVLLSVKISLTAFFTYTTHYFLTFNTVRLHRKKLGAGVPETSIEAKEGLLQ
jgi:hypothetical protein